ncbi:MAG: hypothetical protein MZU79_00730 [Anaerotruncus sp.]|nr:hypothetical protein [Anaerotruncus sp.]
MLDGASARRDRPRTGHPRRAGHRVLRCRAEGVRWRRGKAEASPCAVGRPLQAASLRRRATLQVASRWHALAHLQRAGLCAQSPDRRLPHVGRRHVEDQIEFDLHDEPRRFAQLRVELTRAPARIAHEQPRLRAPLLLEQLAQQRGGPRDVDAVADLDRPRRRSGLRRAAGSRARAPPGPPNQSSRPLSTVTGGSSRTACAAALPVGRFRTSPHAPSAVCWHSRITVRRKFGSSSCGIESSRMGATEAGG